MLPNMGLVISLNSDCIALVPLWPKSRAVSQIFSQLVEFIGGQVRANMSIKKGSLVGK